MIITEKFKHSSNT